MKSECRDGLILFGEIALRHALRQYLIHGHGPRNHQGRDHKLIELHKNSVKQAFPSHSDEKNEIMPV